MKGLAMAGEQAKAADEICPVSKICVDMIDWEEKGGNAEQDHFRELLDPAFRFRRADGVVDDKDEFVRKLPAGAGRGRTPYGEVDVTYYDNMAVAVLRVDVKGTKYRNARVFLRGGPRGWRLVSWCNEEVRAASVKAP
jgi:hypothetical protein